MTSDYSDIYSRFYIRVKDYDLSQLTERMANELLNGYLRSTASKPMVRRLFTSFVMDDDVEEIEYELKEILDEDSDRDFVEEVMAIGMIECWASPRYHSTLLTNQLLTNSEQRYYSQSAHLAEVKELYLKSQNDLRKLIRDRAYSLAVINGVES